MIVIHHAAHSSATVLDIHRWHLENGWSESYYHFLVTKDGKVHRGRPENAIGAHLKGYNTRSLGICLQGNYDVEKVSEIGFKFLIELCQYLCDKYNISTIKDHRELKATNCPGLSFPLDEVSNKVFSNFDTYTVKSGDTLWSIAKSFGLTVHELLTLNDLDEGDSESAYLWVQMNEAGSYEFKFVIEGGESANNSICRRFTWYEVKGIENGFIKSYYDACIGTDDDEDYGIGIKFDFDELPPNAIIEKAVLKLDPSSKSLSSGSKEISVYRIENYHG